jgi:hypothetical protein
MVIQPSFPRHSFSRHSWHKLNSLKATLWITSWITHSLINIFHFLVRPCTMCVRFKVKVVRVWHRCIGAAMYIIAFTGTIGTYNRDFNYTLTLHAGHQTSFHLCIRIEPIIWFAFFVRALEPMLHNGSLLHYIVHCLILSTLKSTYDLQALLMYNTLCIT